MYPVYVDPALNLINAGTRTYGDTFINAGNPNFNYGNYQRPDTGDYTLWLGQSPNPTSDVTRDLFRFDTTALAGLSVDAATLKVYPYHQYYNAPTAETTYLRLITSGPWYESGTGGVTWNTRPTAAGSVTDTVGCVEGNWCLLDATPIVRNWLLGTYPNWGLQVDMVGLDYH